MGGKILMIAIIILVAILLIVIYFSLGMFKTNSTNVMEESIEEEIPPLPQMPSE